MSAIDWTRLVNQLEEDIKDDIAKMKTLKSLWYVPEANAEAGRFNGTVFLGINSGGDDVRDKDEFERFEEKNGISFYHNEEWKKGAGKSGEAPLQIQIRILFAYLYKLNQNELYLYNTNENRLKNIIQIEKEQGYKEFIKGLLAGNICPFQSSSIYNLLYPWDLQKPHLIKFWKEVFKNHLRGETKTIVTMGYDVLDIICSVFNVDRSKIERFSSGWGKQSISYFKSDSENIPTIINLPHLSRFGIFGREKGLKEVEDLFRKVG